MRSVMEAFPSLAPVVIKPCSSAAGPGATFWNLRASNAPPNGTDTSGGGEAGGPATPLSPPTSNDGFREGEQQQHWVGSSDPPGHGLAQSQTCVVTACFKPSAPHPLLFLRLLQGGRRHRAAGPQPGVRLHFHPAGLLPGAVGCQ